MKKLFKFLALSLFLLNLAELRSQNFINSNKWLFTITNNQDSALYVAPKINNKWDWGKMTAFLTTGNVQFPKNIYMHSNKWLLGVTENQDRAFYLAPKINDKWDWGKMTAFLPTGEVQFSGNLYINSKNDYNNIHWAGHHLTMGTKPGENSHNIFILKPGGSPQGMLSSSFHMYRALSASNHELKVQITTNGNSFFNGGNVGIGTDLKSNPKNYRLAVNGTIGAKEINVEMNSSTWSDFVFNNDYELRSINEVERFIKEKKHLPDMPSAEDIGKSGVNLGEMDAKLLQKIEELTLYMIEMNKEIKNLKKENEALRKKSNIHE